MKSKYDSNKPSFLIGIGASAGGLEALESFFIQIPTCPQGNLTFVIVQHLSQDYKSLMAELLSRHTTIPIKTIIEKAPILANHIYLIPPKQILRIERDRFTLTETQAKHHHFPIDAFLISLAESFTSNSIGVILSGTGSDGTLGAKAIRDKGGIVISQEPSSCLFDGMPKSVIKAGYCDEILSPSQIPEFIFDYTTASAQKNIKSASPPVDNQQVSHLIELLQSVEGIPFASYRSSTIFRRIEKRMANNSIATLVDYIDLLKKNRGELILLHNEMLIGVTNFFRDPPSFEVLNQKIIPRIVRESDSDTIRIWVPGCSTGEEAYSIAICFMEFFEANPLMEKKLKIFATDVDRASLRTASDGRYSASIIKDVGEERIAKFFTKKEEFYQINPSIKIPIIFSYHDAVNHPPFTKINLISCRNLLIYFQTELQNRAISLFHFGLIQNGFLFLGKAEALGKNACEFNAIFPKHKIYQKIRDIKLADISELRLEKYQMEEYQPVPNNMNYLKAKNDTIRESKHIPFSEINEYIFKHFFPPCLLIDSNFHLIYSYHDAGKYLKIPKGKSTFDILKMVDFEIASTIRVAISRANSIGSKVIFTDIRTMSCNIKLTLTVMPLNLKDASLNKYYLISFDEQNEMISSSNRTNSDTHLFNINEQMLAHVNELEDRLKQTQISLRNSIEELEKTSMDLKNANQELVAANEELQTSNEELQSVNEELHTVNSEHQYKIDELIQANYDIDFLLKSSNIGLIFLDESLRILRYNKDIQNLINIISSDIGRPITDITFKFEHDKITSQILQVSQTGNPASTELSFKGISYIVKSTPYWRDHSKASINPNTYLKPDSHHKNQRSNGVVLSFIDVSFVKEAKQLKKLTKESEEFNYVVSHDLRKPLRRLSMLSSIIYEKLESSPLSKSFESQVIDIEDTVTLLSKMLDSLLTYSRLRTKGLPFTKFDSKLIIETVLNKLKGQMKDAEVNVKRLPGSLTGDQNQLSEALAHILINSIHHHRAKRKVKILISIIKKSGYWQFSITDNGAGFGRLEPKKAFEIFSKGPHADNHLGVGLAFSKRIIDRHGGTIWIDSLDGIGSTVHFTLADREQPLF